MFPVRMFPLRMFPSRLFARVVAETTPPTTSGFGMFPLRMFPIRMFPSRMFPRSTAAEVGGTGNQLSKRWFPGLRTRTPPPRPRPFRPPFRPFR